MASHVVAFSKPPKSNDDDSGTSSKEQPSDDKKTAKISVTMPPIIEKGLDVIGMVYSAALFVASTAVSLGLLLNVMGYAYEFDRKSGSLQIETIQQLRMNHQFQREINTQQQQQASKNNNNDNTMRVRRE
jgi:hypothetical protein